MNDVYKIISSKLELLPDNAILELNKKYEKLQLKAFSDGNIESSLKTLLEIQKVIISRNLDNYLTREQYMLNLMNLASIKIDLGKYNEAKILYWEILREDKNESESYRNIIIARLIDLNENVESVLQKIVEVEGKGMYTKILELYRENNFIKAKEFLIEMCKEDLERL